MSLVDELEAMGRSAALVRLPEPPPPPDPAVVLYQQVLLALRDLQSAVTRLTLPAPVVEVSEPDFEGLVQAIMQSRPEMLDYDRLAQLVRDAIDIPAPQVTVEAPATDNSELQKVLEGLAFSLKGLGRMGSGGGTVSLQPGQSVSVGNFPATQPVSAVSLPLPTLPATPVVDHVAMTGSAVQLPAHTLVNGALLIGYSSNAASVWVGTTSGVTTGPTGGGFEVTAGGSQPIGVNASALYWAIGTSGDYLFINGS